MPSAYYTSGGQRVDLGRELGRGGEGAVFAVGVRADQVAKIYSHTLSAEKQTKLRLMPAKGDADLLAFAAWPLDTLHLKPNGPPVGFLMNNIGSRAPVHMLYGPAYRRQQYPDAAWNFLLFAARNTAAAFEALHSRGHVLGDVNQGNAMVGRDSKVVLIDCDSFQIELNGQLHHCEVGVSHFTPPELQGLTSFRGVHRTANHDNFGLALLVFHLLFGGRHPYSGVPLRKDVGESLESDIKAFRYAYSADASRRGIAPPPRSIPVNLVPAPIRTMFDAAFLEAGARGARPAAHQWRSALDYLRGHLRRCPNTKMHIYPDHLTACPWCQLEGHGVVYFLALDVSVVPGAQFDIVRIWAAIETVRAPQAPPAREHDQVAATPTPLPGNLLTKNTLAGAGFLLVAAVLALLVLAPKFWWAYVGTAWVVRRLAESPKMRAAERQRRVAELSAAQVAYKNLQARQGGAPGFQEKRQQLLAARDEWSGLAQRETKELEQLKATAKARQKHLFLEGFLIEDAKIPGVGRAKKATLLSFGIETAADVEWDRVIVLRGFGDALTGAMVAWRATCERRFVFDPSRSVSPADIAAVRTNIAVRRNALQALLASGAAELQRLARDSQNRTQAQEQQLVSAGQRLAQARADMSLV